MIRPTSTIGTVITLQRLGDGYYKWNFYTATGLGTATIDWNLDRDTYIKSWGCTVSRYFPNPGDYAEGQFLVREKSLAPLVQMYLRHIDDTNQNYIDHQSCDLVDMTFLQGSFIRQYHVCATGWVNTWITFKEGEIHSIPGLAGLSSLPVIQLEKRACGLWELITGRCYS